MTMETYTLVVREAENGAGIEANVHDTEGLVEASSYVAYEDHNLEADRAEADAERPDKQRVEFSADVLSLRLQLQRLERSFEFRVVGDDAELVRTDVVDGDWGLVDRSA
jgi:hypothetical protein